MIDESKQRSGDSQNIDGVLEELKKSYSSDTPKENDIMNNESSAKEFSRDELQEQLRSQFLNDSVHSDDSSDTDEYVIDEEFLTDAYRDDSDERDQFENDDNGLFDENYDGFSDETEENADEFYEEFGENDSEIEDEEAFDEEYEAFEEEDETLEQEIEETRETFDFDGIEANQKEEIEEKIEEEFEDDFEDDQEITAYEGLEEIQEEAVEQDFEEGYAPEDDQEEVDEDIYLDSDDEYVYDEMSDDEEYYSNLIEGQEGNSSVALMVEEEEDESIEEDDNEEEENEEDSPQKRAEDNYVDVFYRSNDEGPFGNRSFKEIIAETTMSVDDLEAALNSNSQDLDYEPESFEEAEGVPLVLDDNNSESQDDGLDAADLALLHEFGYMEDLLKSVSSESIEKISTEEFENNIDEKINTDEDEPQKEAEPQKKGAEQPKETSESRKAKTKEKINNQYLAYRQMRGAALLKLLISSVLTVILALYELLPIFGVKFPAFIDREKSVPLYVFFGVLLMLFVLIPAFKQIIEGFKNFLISGADAYFMVGVSACLTVLYDFIIIFAIPEYTVAPTFHLCVAIVLVLAQISELLHYMSEVRNYEYYFSEFIFSDEEDVDSYKYTLQKSEGRGSIAEKMYAGGVSPKRVICSPQNVDSTNGFFDANKQRTKNSRRTFPLVIISAVVAFIFTIISAIISGDFWVAMVTFMATFGFTLPTIAIIAEWLPFERLSAGNYAYGSAFASEASLETVAACDMFVFYDSHLFEKCDSKSVNLAIYDSTSKAVLLSCLNAVYSEIGGPLQSALASVKTQSLGECKISRVARSGIEATVGTSFSVLIGDEQFMSRYGIVFPAATLGREEDKIFTLCVSINSRATARIAVKYKLNDVFFNLIQKLSEDKISCVVETYDPMISTALVSRLRSETGFQINIVHKNASDLALEKHRGSKDAALFSALGKDLPILARGSRLNLAVATSNAKKMKFLRLLLNIVAGASAFVGLVISFMLLLFNKFERFPDVELFIILYWILAGAAFAGIMIWKFPRRDRFIFNKK